MNEWRKMESGKGRLERSLVGRVTCPDGSRAASANTGKPGLAWAFTHSAAVR